MTISGNIGPGTRMLDNFSDEPIDKKKVAKRMLSPTQIISYLSCPRKWYYEYVEKVPVPEKFALVRGSVVHKVCEEFFRWRPSPGWSYDELIENMGPVAQGILKEQWEKAEVTKKFGDDRWEETSQMIEKFIQLQKWKMDPIYSKYGDARKAWFFTRPKFRELHVVDKDLAVQGYIDAVIEVDKEEVILVDYKTSSLYRHAVSEDHQRQLYIYALLFERDTGMRPKYVAVVYLLYGQIANYPVRSQFLDEVKDLIAYVHANTESGDIDDYPANTEYKFCKWCDFRKECQGKEPIGA